MTIATIVRNCENCIMCLNGSHVFSYSFADMIPLNDEQRPKQEKRIEKAFTPLLFEPNT